MNGTIAQSPWTDVSPSTHTLEVSRTQGEIHILRLHSWEVDEGRSLRVLVQVGSMHHRKRALRLHCVLPPCSNEVKASITLVRSDEEECWQRVSRHGGEARLTRLEDGSFRFDWTVNRGNKRIGHGQCVIRAN